MNDRNKMRNNINIIRSIVVVCIRRGAAISVEYEYKQYSRKKIDSLLVHVLL